jgi:ketosteroid isomerase-like protein
MDYQIPQLNETQTSFTRHHDDVLTTLENFAEAVRNGNAETIMSFFADTMVAYDMMPPIQFINKNQYQRAWEEYFTKVFTFPINFNFNERTIEINGDLAFANGLVHLEGDTINGNNINNWMRNSTCLKYMNGNWLIINYHNSVPVDAITGNAMLSITPDGEDTAEGELH